MLERQILKYLSQTLRHIDYGELRLSLPNSKTEHFVGKYEGAKAELNIHDIKAIYSFIRKGDIGFAETYRDGWWDSSDLAQVFLFGLQNETALNRYIYSSFLTRMASRFAYFFTRNTLQGSKKNIQAHYDLGNDFYALWLDPSMTYSSALFTDQTKNLTEAQHNKYDRIIDLSLIHI